MEWKIGIGYDSHRFAENKKLILGGVTIPFEKGLTGHSDADVLLHSIIDALLGAVHLGDIGKMFPDNNMHFKNADSKVLLKKVYEKIIEKGYNIGNIDTTVIIQRPKLAEYTERIEKSIAEVLHICEENVSVKAKTNEGMGFIGREEGIAVISVILVRREK